MRTEKRLFINYLFPGTFFPESSAKRVTSTNVPTSVPRDVYAFYFTETEVAVDGKKEFTGETKQVSKTYMIGTAVHVDDIPAILDGRDTDILKSNIRNNSPTKTGIKTHLGNWQMLDERTVVVHPSQFKFSDPLIYKNIGK